MYRAAVESGEIPPGWAVDDGAALRFRGTALAEVVSARPNAKAYAVDATGEYPLDVRALPAPDPRTTTAPAVAELRRLRAGHLRD